MKIEIINKLTEINMKISGTIDSGDDESLKSIFKKIIKLSPKLVSIDVREVISIGFSGIGRIIYLYKDLREIGSKLIILAGNDLYDLFDRMRLTNIITIRRNV